ncbi:MAG: hypothetical protein AAF587_39250 [Bacteroidota bacterium]
MDRFGEYRNNQFIKDAFEALDYIQTDGADEGKVEDLAGLEEKVYIEEGFGAAGDGQSRWLTDGCQRLIFESNYGAEIKDEAGKILGHNSAAFVLLHELAHAKKELIDNIHPPKLDKPPTPEQIKAYREWQAREEGIVRPSENVAAKVLKNEFDRPVGSITKPKKMTGGVTSTTPQDR